ncbi:Swt1 family HEPN domain-containing protein [Paractinoplanes globisporus]|uniref:Swt1 family HEPN domain-containing protein n=1 Tax=Paractinoplanes globisporus TaxID=113565 RepID=A0ABW6WKG8_9ACTN|nr:Swt1 family HEPN domain-containing protein [Actinoplanes globisporus]
MDIGNSINVLENALRDLAEALLRKKHGDKWSEHLGVSEERQAVWQERMEEEPKKRPGGQADNRPLYYSDFYDILQIIRKNWDIGFKDCFKDRKRFDTYVDRLAAFRNPDAHSRSLLPFEEHLVIGMTGELRQEITVFLSEGSGGTEREYFPRIEEVIDSFGNRGNDGQLVQSGLTLRVGDSVQFSGRAWDPDGDDLAWKVVVYGTPASRHTPTTGVDNTFEWEWLVTAEHIRESCFLEFSVISTKDYHKHAGHDGQVTFAYTILPPYRA